jgi:Transposase IS66 family
MVPAPPGDAPGPAPSGDRAGGTGRGDASRDPGCAGDQARPNLAKRFEAHGESYFRFITGPGVEPTNNLAEQAIRFVVIDRLIARGARSESGNRRCERIWTVIATCAQQGRSVFAHLEAAIGAWFEGIEARSLLPGGRGLAKLGGGCGLPRCKAPRGREVLKSIRR